MLKCPSCKNGSFKTEVFEPSGSGFKHTAIACSSCNTVVGVMDFFNVGQMLTDIEKRLKAIEQRIR